MKKTFFLTLACLTAMTIFSCTPEDSDSNEKSPTETVYVDLGLPSGTLWASQNEQNPADPEHGLYTFDEAVAAFGNRVPDYSQLMELKDVCEWEWTDGGYTVTGPNGHSIFLPAAGFRQCEDNTNAFGNDGIYGLYWSSQAYSSDPYNTSAWFMQFFFYPDGEAHVALDAYKKCRGHSVRLVQ